MLIQEPSPSPQPSPVKRPLRNLPDEAMSGVSNDTTVAKPPPFWIPAFAGMTVVQRSRQGRGGLRLGGFSEFLRSLTTTYRL